MTQKLFRALTVCCIPIMICLLALTAEAGPPPGKGGNHQNGNHQGGNRHGGGPKGEVYHEDMRGAPLVSAGITINVARNLASSYGLVGYKGLPPGIAKNLARGKPLPPGIAKRMVPTPMLAKLPVYPGYEWRIAGQDLILIQIATSVIADVLVGIFH